MPRKPLEEEGEFEDDPEPLPLSKTMRLLGLLLLIFGGTELGVGICLFTYFENSKNVGFVGSLLVIICGIFAVCFSSSVAIVCNTFICVAAALIALFLWSFTWAEYGKVTKYTKCLTVTYLIDPTASGWSEYMQACNTKYSNYQCVCSDNEETFCHPYITTDNGYNCSSIITVYYQELQASLGLLALCMLTLGVYVFAVYGALIYYAKESFVFPPIFVKVYCLVKRIVLYIMITLTPTEDSEDNTRFRNLYNKLCSYICVCCYKRQKLSSILPDNSLDKDDKTDNLEANLQREENELINDEIKIKQNVRFARESNPLDPLMEMLQSGQDGMYTDEKMHSVLSAKYLKPREDTHYEFTEPEQQKVEELTHTQPAETPDDFLSKINRFLIHEMESHKNNDDESVGETEDDEIALFVKQREEERLREQEQQQEQQFVGTIENQSVQSDSNHNKALDSERSLNSMSFTRYRPMPANYKPSYEPSEQRNDDDLYSVLSEDEGDDDNGDDENGDGVISLFKSPPTTASQSVPYVHQFTQSGKLLNPRPPYMPSRSSMSSSTVSSDTTPASSCGIDPSLATRTPSLQPTPRFISPLVNHKDPIYAAAALRDYYLEETKEEEEVGAQEVVAAPVVTAPEPLLFTRRKPTSWTPPLHPRPNSSQNASTSVDTSGEVLSKRDKIKIPIRRNDEYYIQNQQKKSQLYLYTRF